MVVALGVWLQARLASSSCRSMRQSLVSALSSSSRRTGSAGTRRTGAKAEPFKEGKESKDEVESEAKKAGLSTADAGGDVDAAM